MLSNSRIYIFKICYQNTTWLSYRQTNQLIGLIAQMFSSCIKDLKFKNIQAINVYETEKYGCQIHINKISYCENRSLSKEQIAELRDKIKIQLHKISQLSFEDILVVNDEFEFKATPGLIGG